MCVCECVPSPGLKGNDMGWSAHWRSSWELNLDIVTVSIIISQ